MALTMTTCVHILGGMARLLPGSDAGFAHVGGDFGVYDALPQLDHTKAMAMFSAPEELAEYYDNWIYGDRDGDRREVRNYPL